MSQKIPERFNIEFDTMLRNTRLNPHTRELVQKLWLNHRQFIQPLFVVEGLKEKQPITSLTHVFRDTPDSLLKQVENDLENGVHKFLLFGVPANKNESSFSFDFTASQIASLRKNFGDAIWLATDVCLCSHTSHGHCGVVEDHKFQKFPKFPKFIDNSKTVAVLVEQALSYAHAGADCIAPSDMMDDRIGSIRSRLNRSGFEKTLLMSYSAKFHSSFYGPFREAADSAPKPPSDALKDRSSYQIDPARAEDALLSSLRDSEQGADILMVKPGLPYLDILSRLSREIQKPWAVYEVSGEYGAIELMAEKNLMKGPRAHIESWTSFIRAGASMIISYGSRHARRWLEENRT